jgi:hypothetical protein
MRAFLVGESTRTAVCALAFVISIQKQACRKLPSCEERDWKAITLTDRARLPFPLDLAVTSAPTVNKRYPPSAHIRATAALRPRTSLADCLTYTPSFWLLAIATWSLCAYIAMYTTRAVNTPNSSAYPTATRQRHLGTRSGKSALIAQCPLPSTHTSRDGRYRRDAGADKAPEQQPDYPSRHPSYPNPSHPSSATHLQTMSAIAPSEAGVDVAWADSEPTMPLPRLEQGLRSALAYSNVNIDIPCATESSLSMELTHDGKVMQLVTRFEPFTEHKDSDAEEAHLRGGPCLHGSTATTKYFQGQHSLRLDGSDTDTVRAASGHYETVKEIVSPQSDKAADSPRKPIPSPWKTTQPHAPVFQTDRRKAEREKRRSLQGAGSSTYLTKDAIEAVNSDITTVSGPSSPTKFLRQQSKASLQSPSGSSARSSPRQAATIKIQVSPARSSRPTVQSHGAASDVQDQGRAPSITPSVISNQGSEYHSAHSPVSLVPSRGRSRRSSLDTWHTAEDHELEPLPFSLTDTDDVEQHATVVLEQHGQQSTRRKPAPQPVSHSRSKTEPHVTGQKPTRPAVPNLTLRVPNAKPPFKAGSASSSHPVLPVSPTKSSSRIPRMAHTLDSSTQASRLKRSQSAKCLKGSAGSGTARGKEGAAAQLAGHNPQKG